MQDLYLPGISTFLRSDSGRQFIKSTSKNSTCIISLDRPEPEKWTEARKATVSFKVYWLYDDSDLIIKLNRNFFQSVLYEVILLTF